MYKKIPTERAYWRWFDAAIDLCIMALIGFAGFSGCVIGYYLALDFFGGKTL